MNWNVPIVDAQGRPTLSFQKQWEQQARANIKIPTDAAAVSALLDKLGPPSGLAGSILRRGPSAWATLATPGGTTKFLRADGTWAEPAQQTVDESEINLSDVLTNNVSTSRHGFAPKLPGDATKFLDGTGAYSTPAGGGGGGNIYVTPGGTFNSNDTGSYATLTNAFIPAADFTIDKLIGSFNAAAVGSVYSMFIAEINSAGAIQSTVVTAASRVMVTQTGFQTAIFDIPSTTLIADTLYIVALVITSGTGSTPCRAMSASGAIPAVGVPISTGAMNATWGAPLKRLWYAQNSDAPTSGSPSSSATSTQYHLGFRAQV
jgi:hypothetical protein